MSIESEKFEKIKTDFGHFSSWAVWAPEGPRPKYGVGDLSIFDISKNSSILSRLHVKTIIVGLNISRPIERIFGNFHDPSPRSSDYKLRYALTGSLLEGSYMTDIIKGVEEKSSDVLMHRLRKDPCLERKNCEIFLNELDAVEAKNPTLVAVGSCVETILKRNFGGHFQVIKIPHYANYISKESYRKIVFNSVSSASLTTKV